MAAIPLHLGRMHFPWRQQASKPRMHRAAADIKAVLQPWRPIARTAHSAAAPRRAGSRASQPQQHVCSRAGRLSRAATGPLVLAMVNVDFASPSLVLGSALIACGIILLQARNMQKRVSRDADIVVAAMVSIVGSTLIFQGWRLDPLLLLCQALTTSVAFWYGMETFKLRSQIMNGMDGLPPQLSPPEEFYSQPYDQPASSQRPGYLAPAERPPAPWEVRAAAGAPQDGYASSSGAGAPWGQNGTRSGGQYDETIRYDYYGNPIEQQYDEVYYQKQQQQGYAPGPSTQPYASEQYMAGDGQYGYSGGRQYDGTAGYDGAPPGDQQQQQQQDAAGWGSARGPLPRIEVYEKIDDWE